MTRRDWWLGVLLLTAAILAHAAFPRYQWDASKPTVLFDHWLGRLEVIYLESSPTPSRR